MQFSYKFSHGSFAQGQGTECYVWSDELLKTKDNTVLLMKAKWLYVESVREMSLIACKITLSPCCFGLGTLSPIALLDMDLWENMMCEGNGRNGWNIEIDQS